MLQRRYTGQNSVLDGPDLPSRDEDVPPPMCLVEQVHILHVVLSILHDLQVPVRSDGQIEVEFLRRRKTYSDCLADFSLYLLGNILLNEEFDCHSIAVLENGLNQEDKQTSFVTIVESVCLTIVQKTEHRECQRRWPVATQ